MGNTGGLAGGGWLYAEEATHIVVRLHDARGVGITADERLSGVFGGERTWRDVPAVLSIGASMTTLAIEFQVVQKKREERGGRVAGEVLLPLEYIYKRCGGSLYHMWLPLQQGEQEMYRSQPADAAPHEYFERALRTAARDPKLPVVCISVGQKGSPQDLEWYDFNATTSQKTARFYSLLQSHAQHARLLQALYRQCRSTRQSRMEQSQGSALDESWAEPALRKNLSRSGYVLDAERVSDEAGQPRMLGAANRGSEAWRLRQEIDSTTEEANARINQASEAIRTLKDRLGVRQVEHERLRRETAELNGEAERLEDQNAQLAAQLQRRAGDSGTASRGQGEVQRLQRDVRFLQEQKDALVQILEDLYGAAGKENPPAVDSPDPAAAYEPSAVEPLARAAPPPPKEKPGFKNLLPRPSRLFEEGGLD